MIKVSNYSKDGNIVKFEVSGIEVRMLNAFRRTIISGVPVMAIDRIIYYTNSSILNDELLGHRIGLIPLTTDLKTYVPQSKCPCKGEGCARCVCKLTLDVTGPKTVYSGDFVSKDENVKPVYDKMPLVKILDEQNVKLEADAVLGCGSEHVKWQGGLASYEISDKDTFNLTVESYGPLPVEELIKKAFEVVEEKIKVLKDEVA